jgi:23S rRNA (cytidine1920-2'-O)/16S rRNA (cytidine1409-2'-O)-methyltransferase
MRLDVFLHRQGYFDSRSMAKEAIKRGLVKVNGEIVTKPSKDVRGDEKIEVLAEGRPRGYYKLKMLDERFNLISENDTVLDLGSSAGGFVLYASEKARIVYGIEFSREFEERLRRIEAEKPNVRIFIEDVFRFDVSKLPELDVILCDLTLEPRDALVALLRFLPKLKRSGKVLFVSKSDVIGDVIDLNQQLRKSRISLDLLTCEKSEDRQEYYYIFLRK